MSADGAREGGRGTRTLSPPPVRVSVAPGHLLCAEALYEGLGLTYTDER